MSAHVLRPATVGDAEALAAIGRSTFIETFVEDFRIPYPAADLEVYFEAHYSVASVRRRLLDAAQAWWVIERAGKLVGYANAGPNGLPHPEGRPTHAELSRLYVVRKAQGTGLGRQLFEVAFAWMEAHSDGPLWISVWSGNHRAQRLYAKYGFEIAGEYKYRVGTWFDDELILRRSQS